MKQAKFNIERRKDKDGNLINKNVPVRLSFFFDGNRFEYYTQVRLNNGANFNKDYFKTGKPFIKSNEPEAGRKNKRLKDIKTKVESLYDNAIALGIKPTPEYLRKNLDEHFKGKEASSEIFLVKDAFKQFIEHTEGSKSVGTAQRINTTHAHLEAAFGKKFNKLTFNEVDSSLVEKFKQYFNNTGFERKDGKHNYLHNTVVKYVRCFREFINWCADEKRQYHSGKINYGNVQEEDINIIYLQPNEIAYLETVLMPTESLNHVRDVFLFGCYTGLRHSDLYKLKKKDVLINNNAIRFYITKGKKTTWHQVPLVEQSKTILDKYKDIRGEKALPVVSNQKMNEYLKTVMKTAGFDELLTIREVMGNGMIQETEYNRWELITCHTSRKSFISYAVASGMPEIEIKAITGHSKNSRAFGRYYEISDQQKQKAMNKVFKKKKRQNLLLAV